MRVLRGCEVFLWSKAYVPRKITDQKVMQEGFWHRTSLLSLLQNMENEEYWPKLADGTSCRRGNGEKLSSKNYPIPENVWTNVELHFENHEMNNQFAHNFRSNRTPK